MPVALLALLASFPAPLASLLALAPAPPLPLFLFGTPVDPGAAAPLSLLGLLAPPMLPFNLPLAAPPPLVIG